MSGWNGIVAPAGTDPKVIAKLNLAINEILAQPDVQEKLLGLGLIPTMKTPQEFESVINNDTERFARLAKEIGFEPR